MRISVLFLAGLFIMLGFVTAHEEAFTLTLGGDSPDPEVIAEIEDHSYTIELLSAADDSATLKVTNAAGESQEKEIAEDSAETVLGLIIMLESADIGVEQTTVMIEVSDENTSEDELEDENELEDEHEGEISSSYITTIHLSTSEPTVTKAISSKTYSFTLISATEESAKVKIANSNGESLTETLIEDKTVFILGLKIMLEDAEISEEIMSVDIKVAVSPDSDKSLEKGYGRAFWKCYDGTEGGSHTSNTDSSTYCKTSEKWAILAKEFCSDRCENEKCGVNAFTIGKECSISSSGEIKYSTEKEDDKEDNPVKAQITTEGTSVCINSCLSDNKCYPFGYRKSGEYCSDESKFIAQLEAGVQCDNSFQCSSNVCVNSECVSGTLIARILNWFKESFR